MPSIDDNEQAAEASRVASEAAILREAAIKRFGGLLPGEEAVLAYAPSRQALKFGVDEADRTAINFTKWKNMDRRTIRADLIRWLYSDPRAAAHLDAGGLYVEGALIHGTLDLAFVKLNLPLQLKNCLIPDGIDLNLTQSRTINLAGSLIRAASKTGIAINGDSLTSNGDLQIENAMVLGEVDLVGATIYGDVAADGALFESWVNAERDMGTPLRASEKPSEQQRVALDARYARITGSLILANGFRAIGAVNLTDADVGEDLLAVGGRFSADDGWAIDAIEAHIHGDTIFRPSRVTGGMNFALANLGGNFWCAGRFAGSTNNRTHTPKGNAPVAASLEEATIHGDADFDSPFEAAGLVTLQGARIGGTLSFVGSHFASDKPASNNGVDARFMNVSRAFYWQNVELDANTLLLLDHSRVKVLFDDQGWPSPGRLSLEGFVYETIDPGSPMRWGPRLRWLNRQQDAYQPQPYTQLAQVLQQNGMSNDAKEILIAEEAAQRRSQALGEQFLIGRAGLLLWSWFLRWTIGYGHSPFRALLWIVPFVAIGTLLFSIAYRAGVITPTETEAYKVFIANHDELPEEYQPFSAFIYSLENFLPLVRLRQEEFWQPNPSRKPIAVRLWGKDRIFGDKFGRRMRRYLWLHTLAGWVLTPLFLAGLSGVVRPM